MALSVRSVSLRAAARPCQSIKPVRSSVRMVVARAEQAKASIVEQAIQNAEKACADGENTEACVQAWDTVEEVSAAVAHKKANETTDPLEKFCEGDPSADECRVYE